ncbi:MAG: transcription antitermination protein NusB [Bacteroidaceae bacterium]|nr:transcription antitermination protein NusB [Bacteroidaceae bacterium]
MINRQLIRLKALQVFYAYVVDGQKTPAEAEKEYAVALERAHELYLYLLNFLVDIRRQAEITAGAIEARNERLGLRIAASSAERVLADNKWLNELEANDELQDYRSKHNDQTDEEVATVRRLVKAFIESDTFQLYLKKEDRSPEADQEVVRRLYKTIVAAEDFESLLEERSIYWNDDKDIIDTFVLKTIKRITPGGGTEQPLLPAWGAEDDQEFAMLLLREAIARRDETYRLVAESTNENWDIERVALMDVLIIQLALAEMLGVPQIPLSITINEYINIAKCYSTPRSASYINATLDTLAKQLRQEGRLMKN